MSEVDVDKVAKDLSGLMPAFNVKFIKPMIRQTKSSFISPLQQYALFVLSEKSWVTMTELSNEMKISKQQVTPLIDNLIKNGFIKRRHDEVDRRAIKIKLTTSGCKYIEDRQKDIVNIMRAKIESLSKEDLISLHGALNELYRIMNEIP